MWAIGTNVNLKKIFSLFSENVFGLLSNKLEVYTVSRFPRVAYALSKITSQDQLLNSSMNFSVTSQDNFISETK